MFSSRLAISSALRCFTYHCHDIPCALLVLIWAVNLLVFPLGAGMARSQFLCIRVYQGLLCHCLYCTSRGRATRRNLGIANIQSAMIDDAFRFDWSVNLPSLLHFSLFACRTMPEMLTELDKPTDLRVYTIAQVRCPRGKCECYALPMLPISFCPTKGPLLL